MKLVWLSANQAWAFSNGESLIQLKGQCYFYPASWEAIAAARALGLEVNVNTGKVSKSAPKGWGCISGGDTA